MFDILRFWIQDSVVGTSSFSPGKMCKLLKHWALKWHNLKKTWLADQMFEYETLWQVVSILPFSNQYLTGGTVFLKVSIESPIMVSNVPQNFWCVLFIFDLNGQLRMCREVPLCFCVNISNFESSKFNACVVVFMGHLVFLSSWLLTDSCSRNYKMSNKLAIVVSKNFQDLRFFGYIFQSSWFLIGWFCW